MSVLSIQIGKLREKAEIWQKRGCYEETSALLLDAADTIESLRDRLQAETLGSGTCEMHEDIGATQTLLTCSECGYTTRDYSPIFCGGCGARIRRVVDE